MNATPMIEQTQTLSVAKPAQTRVPINPVLGARWSPRAYLERPVEPHKLLSLFEAARWSPSSMNEQPWSFIVASKDETETYRKLFDSLFQSNQRWAHRAPLLILAVARNHHTHTGKLNSYAWYDVGQAVAHLSIQAETVGLSAHQLGGFDREKARLLLNVPDEFEPVVVIAVGYRDNPDILPSDLQQREVSLRVRKPLESFVFTEIWGIPSRHVISTSDFPVD